MKDFADALEGAFFIEQKVRDLIIAAGQGDLGRYRTILRQLDFSSITRDYAMVLIILSPIVAVIKAAEKRGDTESTDSKIAELERRVNAILGKQKFKNLCTAIGEGNGDTIWSTLDPFKNYKELLTLLAGRKEPSDKFIQRVINITPWTSINKIFINTKLIPFVRDTLGIRFSTAFGQRLRHTPSAPVASGSAAAAATTTTTTTTEPEPEPMPVKELTEEDAIQNSLETEWKKRTRLANGTRNPRWEETQSATAAHQKLVKEEILFAKDAPSSYGSGFSENFIKLFIRYLERSFPKLKEYVKIYYYSSPVYSPTYNYGAYWDNIEKLRNQSIQNHMIYFIVNQSLGSLKAKPANRRGHVNLTVVYGGKYKVFESVKSALHKPFGARPSSGMIEATGGDIQADDRNCVTIALGYLESLMKQIDNTLKKSKVLDKQALANQFAQKIDKFLEVPLLPESKIGPNKESPLKTLLPPKYIKYMQSKRSIDALTSTAKESENSNNRAFKDVEQELDKVTKKYLWSAQPLQTFLNNLIDDSYDAKSYFAEVVKTNPDITVLDLTKLMESKKLSEEVFNNIRQASFDWTNHREPLINFVESPEEKSWVKEELQKNIIYKWANKTPENLTFNELCTVDAAYRILQRYQKRNARVDLKRQTEVLKVATLVDVLDKRRESSETIQDKVRDEIGKVEELRPSPQERAET